MALLTAAAMALTVAPAAVAAPTWTPIRRLNPSDEESRAGQMAVARDGTVHVLLPRQTSEGPYNLYVARRRPGKSWETPHLLATGDPSYGAITVDHAGNVTAAWAEVEGENRQLRAARRPAGGAWTASRDVSALRGSVYDPVIATDPMGNVTVVWEETGSLIMAATKPVGLPWGEPVQLSAGGQYPRIVSDDSGNLTVVYNGNGGIESNARTVTGSWAHFSNPVLVSPPGQSAFDAELTVDAGGTVIAAWYSEGVIYAARKPVGGTWEGWEDPLSSGDVQSSSLALAAGPAGNAVAVWEHDGVDDVIEATKLVAGTWQPPTVLSPSGWNAEEPAVVVDVAGVATVVWSRYDEVTDFIEARRSTATGWSARQRLSPSTMVGLEPVVAADRQRNVVVAWRGVGIARARALDVGGPRSTTTRPTPAFSLTDPTVAWRAVDTWSPVASYQVRYRAAPAASGFSAQQTWLASTTATSQSFGSGTRGATYCFSARATDAVGNTGPFSGQRCTALPLNDRALTASAGWTRRDAPAAYVATMSTTTTAGATLTSAPVSARRIALVASRAPGSGSVRVYLGDDLLRTVALTPTASQDPTRTYRKQVIPIETFAGREAGVVRIVTTSTKPVSIEGLGISAR